MEYYSAIRRNKIESTEAMWMNLEPVIQSEVRKRKTSNKKMYWWTYFQGRNRGRDMQNGLVDTAGGSDRQTNQESSTDTHTYTAAAAAASLQSCPTLCNPIDTAHQAPPSLGFSRQEHWSGLPFPSPRHKSEKWKWSCSVVSDSSRPHGLPPRLLRPWDFPGKSTEMGCHCLLWYIHYCV